MWPAGTILFTVDAVSIQTNIYPIKGIDIIQNYFTRFSYKSQGKIDIPLIFDLLNLVIHQCII